LSDPTKSKTAGDREVVARLTIDSENAQDAMLARLQSVPQTIGAGIPYVVVPNNYQVRSLEHLLTSPVRTRARAAFVDVESFAAYVSERKTDRTIVTADENGGSVTAILDYHHERAAAFGEHIASLKLTPTDEWKAWLGMNGKRVSQHTFAEFLEDNLPDIAEPAGAVVLEVAKSLQIDKKIRFLSSTRLQDGNREFVYEEAQEASASKGTLHVPESFTLGLAPYLGSSKYSLTARLRFRMEEGKLALWYDLLRPHKVVEDAFNNVVAQLVTGLKTPILRGTVTIPPCAG
jgi:uncharacterized protein YfdQ (DUF2303 family)